MQASISCICIVRYQNIIYKFRCELIDSILLSSSVFMMADYITEISVVLVRRFDCGSGVGVVRSEETVILNQWNHITLYRHRWDAWLQLNGGKHVQGRSKVGIIYIYRHSIVPIINCELLMLHHKFIWLNLIS